MQISDYVVIDIETTGLEPLHNRIITIGLNPEKGEPKVLYEDDEKTLLEKFWQNVQENQWIVGFNVYFDIQFIRIRSLLHRIKMKKLKLLDLREFLTEFYKGNRKGTLKDYSQLIGSNYEDVDGKEVPKLYKNGKIDEIIEHNFWDVVRTKELFEAMKEIGYFD